jgi:hypothetical protein
MYIKHQILAATGSPKIICIGGSNVYNGIDGQMLEEGTHYSIVNYGYIGGTPLSFYIKEVSPYIQKGDLVIFILEYGYYFNKISERSIAQLIESYPQGIRNLPAGYFWNFIAETTDSLPRKYQNFILDNLSWKAFHSKLDQYGDRTDLLDYKGNVIFDVPNGEILSISEVDQNTINDLNQFNAYAQKIGAKVLVMYPSFWDQQYAIYDKPAKDLDKYLKDHLDFPVLGDPERYTFKRKYMSDTSLHLNREGRRLRTNLMIEDLEKSGLITP